MKNDQRLFEVRRWALWLSFSFSQICVAFSPLPAVAGYLVVKRVALGSHAGNQDLIEPLPLNDPHSAEIHQLMHDHTWPTAQKPDQEHPEEEELKKALSQKTHLKNYDFIWVPDTLQDLHCAGTLLQQKGLGALQNLNGKPMSRSLMKDSVFAPRSDLFVEQIFKADRNKQSSPARAPMAFYVREFELRGQTDFFRCNHALGSFLIGQEPLVSISTSATPRAQKTKVIEMFNDAPTQRMLRATVAQRYQKEAKQWNTTVANKLIEIPETEFNPEMDTVLDRVIALEKESQAHNQALLFRGTNGISSPKNELALDDAFFPGQKRVSNYSLSFGTTLFAGLFQESEDLLGACAKVYFDHYNFGYAIRVSKNDPAVHKLFEIPRFDLIGRLFAAGEYFHPRSKVGVKGVDNQLLVAGVEMSENWGNVEGFRKTGLLINENETPVELSNQVNQFIADHAVVLTRKGNLATKEEQESALRAQGSLNPTPTSSYLRQLAGALASQNSQTRAAGERVLGKIKDDSDFHRAIYKELEDRQSMTGSLDEGLLSILSWAQSLEGMPPTLLHSIVKQAGISTNARVVITKVQPLKNEVLEMLGATLLLTENEDHARNILGLLDYLFDNEPHQFITQLLFKSPKNEMVNGLINHRYQIPPPSVSAVSVCLPHAISQISLPDITATSKLLGKY